MQATRELTITLTLDQAQIVADKVATGDYASESEVVGAGLRTLAAQDEALEAWLQDVIVPEYDRIAAGEVELMTPNQVRATLGLPQRSRRDHRL